MRILISIFLISATLAGVFTGADSFCLESHETQILAASSHTSQANRNDSNSTPDCHHKGSSCHSCHLGHCAFVMSKAFIGLVSPNQKILSPKYLITFPSDYSSSLFRPPIA